MGRREGEILCLCRDAKRDAKEDGDKENYLFHAIKVLFLSQES